MDIDNMGIFSLLILVSELSLLVNGHIDQVKNGYEGPIIITPESMLHTDLFQSKGQRTFPTRHQVLDVHFGLTLKSVVDIDASNEAVILNAYIRQDWTNLDLTWKPEDYDGIKKINIHPEVAWIPDIFVYANIEDDKKYNGLLSTMSTKIILTNTGKHSWLAPVMIRLGCTMNFKDYPFDTQVCPIQFGSFTYDMSKVNLIPDSVDMNTYSVSAEWIFKSMANTSGPISYPGSNIPFSTATYTLIVKRKPLHLIINLVLPNVLLAFLTVMVFILPVTAGERASFVLTILLALSWIVTSSVNTMPSSCEVIPFFSYFIGMVLFALFLLSICLCYSMACHYSNANVFKIPPFIRRQILEKLSLHFGINVKRRKLNWRQKYTILRKYEEERHLQGMHCFGSNPGELWSHGREFETSFSSKESANNLEEMFGKQNLGEINEQISLVIDELLQRDDKAWLNREWKIVALTLDKLFLYIFSSVYLTTIVSCGFRLTQIE